MVLVRTHYLSQLCLCSVLDLTPLALHTISVPQHSGVGASCGTAVALALWSRWDGPSCFSLRRELHLHFWEMEIHIPLGHPSTPPKVEQLACTHPSVFSSCSWIWNIRGKGADRSKIRVLGECKGCLKSCYSIIVIVIWSKLREVLWFCRAAATQSLYSPHL